MLLTNEKARQRWWRREKYKNNNKISGGGGWWCCCTSSTLDGWFGWMDGWHSVFLCVRQKRETYGIGSSLYYPILCPVVIWIVPPEIFHRRRASSLANTRPLTVRQSVTAKSESRPWYFIIFYCGWRDREVLIRRSGIPKPNRICPFSSTAGCSVVHLYNAGGTMPRQGKGRGPLIICVIAIS